MANLTYELIGKRLKAARKTMGLKQEQVANFLGVPREYISYYENGTRPIDTISLNKLADLYGYSLSYFLKVDHHQGPFNVFLALRADGLDEDDLKTIAWAKRFVMDFNSIKQLLEDSNAST